MTPPDCRSCGAILRDTVIDLGRQPLSNAFLRPDGVSQEVAFPLHARFCRACFLVQVDEVVDPTLIFSDYAYFSSYSQTWVAHAGHFVERAVRRFALDESSFVVEIASNDGYLLRHVVARGIRALGVEPAANIAAAAIESGIPTDVEFFGSRSARAIAQRHGRADLIVANNVLAHVPDLNDFTAGLRHLLAPHGVISVEVPHLLCLIDDAQFDTIYHEHFSYFSLLAVESLFHRHGLRIFDIERLDTHGGSLRISAASDRSAPQPSVDVRRVLADEQDAHLDEIGGFASLEPRARSCADGLLRYLQEAGERGSRVAAYGAAAKGNTLLNYAKVTGAQVGYVVDRNPHKQGLLLPGSHLSILPVEHLLADEPDIVLILPWNLRDEIISQLPEVRGWGGRFVVAVPEIVEVG